LLPENRVFTIKCSLPKEELWFDDPRKHKEFFNYNDWPTQVLYPSKPLFDGNGSSKLFCEREMDTLSTRLRQRMSDNCVSARND